MLIDSDNVSLPARAKYYDPFDPSTSNHAPSDPPVLAKDPVQDDSMLLDDTKHTTYIHDLDRELAESDSPPGALVILPLAERMLTVPESVLANDSSQGKELVLYTDPSSLSVPKEQDSVRRAIIESRARARAKKESPVQQPAQPVQPPPSNDILMPTLYSTPDDYTTVDADDPMDIDGE